MIFLIYKLILNRYIKENVIFWWRLAKKEKSKEGLCALGVESSEVEEERGGGIKNR